MYNQNSPYKYDIKTLDITLKSGESIAEKEIKLDKGIAIGVAVKPNNEITEILNIGFYENGQEINPSIHVDFYRDREIGTHPFDGFMPLNTLGNANVEVRLSALKNGLSKAVTVQVVFAITKNFTEC